MLQRRIETERRIGHLDMDDGVRLRLAHWAVDAPRATVLILNGRTEFIEKHDEAAEDLLVRGFDVRSFDWRGQGLSTRPLANRQKGHVDDYRRYVDDLAAVVEHVAAQGAGRPLLLLAHSMGGNIALHYLADHRESVAAAILTAPMVGFGTGFLPDWVMAAAARVAVAFGDGTGYAFGEGDWPPDVERFEGNSETGDRRRHAILQRYFRDNPELRLGGTTWRWLDASLRSCRALLRPELTGRIVAPVMVAMAGRDIVVCNRTIERVVRMIPRAVVKTYPDSLHEILMERDEIRDAFWADAAAFVDGLGL